MAKAHCMVTTFDPTTNQVLPGATVNVYTPGTVTPVPVTLFDKNGNVLTNPLTSDATTGLVDFYLNAAQDVDLVVSKGGFTTRTYSNVPVIDDASNALTALMTATGDMVYASGANTPVHLPIGSSNQVLTVVGGVPVWRAVTQGSTAGNLGDVTTTSTAFQDTSLDVTITTNGGNVLCIATFTGQNDTNGDTWEAKCHYDAGDGSPFLFPSTEETRTIATLFTGVSAGSHTFSVQFKVTSAGTARIIGSRNTLIAIELKD